MRITTEKLNQITNQIVKHIKPYRIFLFGSQADNTANADSDVDLLVVANLIGSTRERRRQVRKLFPRRDFSLDVFVLTPQELDRQKDWINSIGYVAVSKGRVIYER